MFSIDLSDPTPVEVQIVREVQGVVGAGLLEPGDQLPTVRQLAVQLRVNANAVERAYQELERLGVVASQPGVGVFVAGAAGVDREAALAQLAALEDDFLRRAAALGFSRDEIIIHLDSRRET